MKRVLLIEIDVPEDEEPKKWFRTILAEYKVQVRHLRFRDFEHYDNENDYWRFG